MSKYIAFNRWDMGIRTVRLISEVLLLDKEMLKKDRSRWYPAETIINADSADNLTLFANTPVQAEYLLHSW